MSDSTNDAASAAASRRGRRSGRDRGEEASQDLPAQETEAAVAADADEADASAEGADEPSEVDRLQAELDALNDRHLRLAAEFDNFRRRSHSQLGESGVRAQATLVGRLLDVVDDLERVSSLDPEAATAASVVEGVELVERKLHRVLSDAGLEPIDPEGEPFDPNSMEAMLMEPTTSPEEDDTVGQVLQRGFRFRGHLVRPARVSVRKFED